MAILQLEKPISDGRLTNFHKVSEFHVDMSSLTMSVIIESYESVDSAKTAIGPPVAFFTVEIPLPDWSPVYADNLLNFVCSDPSWSTATVLE